MGYNIVQEEFAFDAPHPNPPLTFTLAEFGPFSAAPGYRQMDTSNWAHSLLNSAGSWTDNGPSLVRNGIDLQSIGNAQSDGQPTSSTKGLDFFLHLVKLDQSITSSAKQRIKALALQIETILQDRGSYDSTASPATPDQFSQVRSLQNLAPIIPLSQASASAMSTNSRSPVRTTASHISAQTHVTVPGSIQSSDYDQHEIGEKAYHCTKKDCSKSFLRKSDWVRHEETHWPQRRYLCLQCIPQRQTIDGICRCGCCQCLIQEDWEIHSLSCREARSIGAIITRWEHLRNHLSAVHRMPRSKSKECAKKWFFAPESAWPRQCGFCGESFDDWKKRINHVERHFIEEQAKIDKWTIPFVFSPVDRVEPTLYYTDEDDSDDDMNDDIMRGRPRTSQDSQVDPAGFNAQGNSSNQADYYGQYSSDQRYVNHNSTHSKCAISIAGAKNEDPTHPSTVGHSNVATSQVVQKLAGRVLLKRSPRKSVPVQFGSFVKYQPPEVFQEVKGLDESFCSYIKDLFGFTTVAGGLSTAMSPVLEESLRWRMLEPSDNNGPFPNRLDYFAIWAGCLASAISFLDEHNMAHRGLTSDNVLVQGTMVVLHDFEAMTRECSSFDAEELSPASRTSRTGSIAFLGCIFIELMTVLESIPLSDMLASCPESPQAPNEYLSSCRNWIKSLSDRIESLPDIAMIERMISHNAMERPTSSDVRAYFAGPACFCQDGYSGDNISFWGKILTKRLSSSIAPKKFTSLLEHLPTGPTPLDLYVAQTIPLDDERSINPQTLQRSSTQSDYTFNTSLSRSQTLTIRPASSITSIASDFTQSKIVPTISLPRHISNLTTIQSTTSSDIGEAPEISEERKCTLACLSSSAVFSTSTQAGQIPRSAVTCPDFLSSLNTGTLSNIMNSMENSEPRECTVKCGSRIQYTWDGCHGRLRPSKHNLLHSVNH
jgi:hypothetical protein